MNIPSHVLGGLVCAGRGRADNGMHPTADTLLVIYIESLRTAGDAER